jgi:hypothetical protein
MNKAIPIAIYKKAAEKAIYSPGVVAHEAGHAWMHNHPQSSKDKRTDIIGAVETAANLIPLAYAGKMLVQGKWDPNFLTASSVSQIPRLIDEYASSVKGHSSLKDKIQGTKKLSEKGLAQERNKLIAAGSTYAATPISLLAARYGSLRAGLITQGLAIIGASAANNYLETAKGPKVTASEAKRIVEAISPGVDVYTSKKPMAGGSVYMPPANNILSKVLHRSYLSQYFSGKDLDKIVNRGGVLLAPLGATDTITPQFKMKK